MNYQLDTNAAIALINTHANVRKRAQDLLGQRGKLSISSVALFELWFGVANGQQFERNANALRSFLAGSVTVLPFAADEAHAAGELRATLAKSGTPIGPYDLLIAAHALRLGATLVTANMREFSRVPGLALEDWTKPL